MKELELLIEDYLKAEDFYFYDEDLYEDFNEQEDIENLRKNAELLDGFNDERF